MYPVAVMLILTLHVDTVPLIDSIVNGKKGGPALDGPGRVSSTGCAKPVASTRLRSVIFVPSAKVRPYISSHQPGFTVQNVISMGLLASMNSRVRCALMPHVSCRRTKVSSGLPRGGEALKASRGAEFYVAIGQMGGSAVKARYGVDHYSRIGKIGGRGRRKAG